MPSLDLSLDEDTLLLDHVASSLCAPTIVLGYSSLSQAYEFARSSRSFSYFFLLVPDRNAYA
eukprot:8556647-Ditylum_brightwellii.AAC.1